MKRKRNFVVAILLVAIMCVGVGYAAIDSQLGVTGTIKYDPAFAIAWKPDSLTLDGTTHESEIKDVNGTSTLTFSVDTTDWNINDFCTIKATIKNDSKYNATDISATTVTYSTTNDYFSVTVGNIADIDSKGEGEVTITIKLLGYPQVGSTYSETFSFTVTARQDVPS